MGAWIEIFYRNEANGTVADVAPLVGAWIEIAYKRSEYQENPSLPLWERGLKSSGVKFEIMMDEVAPLVGAWIEIQMTKQTVIENKVAPLVGAWIEIIPLLMMSIYQ